MVVVLLALILFALLFPGVLRFLILSVLALVGVLFVMEAGKAKADTLFTVQNKTCKKMDYVNIDGRIHGPLISGDVTTQSVEPLCNHHIVAGSGPSLWRNTSSCTASPFENQTMNLVDDEKSSESLPENTITVDKEEYGNAGRIIITNKSDCIVIQGMKANRGNCKISPQQIHTPLKFGDQNSYVFYCGKLLELNVETNVGNDIFSWKN